MKQSAIIIGASGVIGRALSERLVNAGWQVTGVSRGRTPQVPGVESLHADLTVADSLTHALKGYRARNLFFTAWSRQATEAENIRVNGALVANVLQALGPTLSGGHVGLVTGLKHYLGPFESYGKGVFPATPFKEEQGRLPVANFYYTQEDRLFEAAARFGFGWSVHRPHTIVGYAIGNAMNIGVTLAVYASVCRELGKPMVFPGSQAQWDGITDMTDADLLASQLEWAATTELARNQDFNAVNGDVFRWKWMWPRLAQYFGVEASSFDGVVRPLEHQMKEIAPLWNRLAMRHGLKIIDVDSLASWWHTDADLGRPFETFTDMSKSRRAGFLEYRDTLSSFYALFDRLRAEQVIPAA
jgi:nucleoside-diphosphate-sugar epimerase